MLPVIWALDVQSHESRGLLDGYRRLGRGAFLTEWSGRAQLLEGLKARPRNIR